MFPAPKDSIVPRTQGENGRLHDEAPAQLLDGSQAANQSSPRGLGLHDVRES